MTRPVRPEENRLRRERTSRTGLRAFTLIELLVVVMIMAIVAAMVVPYATGTSSMQIMAAARRIAVDLEYAQNAAITTQTPITVTFVSATETYQLSNASGVLIHPINKKDYLVDFGSEDGFDRVDIVSASFNGTAVVTFDSVGTPDNSGAVTLKAGPNTYRVDVAPATGKVTVTATGP